MNKTITRIVALLLVSCLLLDPATAFAFRVSPIIPNKRQAPIFESQALIPVLAVSLFLGLGMSTHPARPQPFYKGIYSLYQASIRKRRKQQSHPPGPLDLLNDRTAWTTFPTIHLKASKSGENFNLIPHAYRTVGIELAGQRVGVAVLALDEVSLTLDWIDLSTAAQERGIADALLRWIAQELQGRPERFEMVTAAQHLRESLWRYFEDVTVRFIKKGWRSKTLEEANAIVARRHGKHKNLSFRARPQFMTQTPAASKKEDDPFPVDATGTEQLLKIAALLLSELHDMFFMLQHSWETIQPEFVEPLTMGISIGLAQSISVGNDLRDLQIGVDPQTLGQVLSREVQVAIAGALAHLIPNAIRAMETTDKRILTIATGSEDNKSFVRISDTGVGIPQEDLEKIWSPSFSTKVQVPRGKGLPYAKKTIEDAGGQLTVDSILNQGSSFTMWFPVAPPISAARQGLRQQRSGQDPLDAIKFRGRATGPWLPRANRFRSQIFNHRVRHATGEQDPEKAADATSDQFKSDLQRYLRPWIRPALQQLLRKVLLRAIKPGDRVLEVGAGPGEMVRLLEGSLPPRMTWVETEPNEELLRERRPVPTEQHVTSLPMLSGIPDASANVITGLSVLDVLPENVLQQSFQSFVRIGKPGARIVQILDLGPTDSYHTMIPVEPGFISLVFDDHSATEVQISVCYIDIKKLEGLLLQTSSRPTSDVLEKLKRAMAEPNRYKIAYGPETAKLKELLNKLGVLAPKIHSFREIVMTKMSSTARMAGLTHVEVREVTQVVKAKKAELPGWDYKDNALRFRYGWGKLSRVDPMGPLNPNMARIHLTAIVLTAQVPLTIPNPVSTAPTVDPGQPELPPVETLTWQDTEAVLSHVRALLAEMGWPMPRDVYSGERLYNGDRHPFTTEALHQLAGNATFQHYFLQLRAYDLPELADVAYSFCKKFGILQEWVIPFRYTTQARDIITYISQLPSTEPVRIHVASTWHGEDAYSLAILHHALHPDRLVEITGTDLVTPDVTQINWIAKKKIPSELTNRIPDYFNSKTHTVLAFRQDVLSELPVTLKQGDMTQPGTYSPNQDIIVANGVLGQSITDDALEQALEQIWQALKPGGRFYTDNSAYRRYPDQKTVVEQVLDSKFRRQFRILSEGVYEKTVTAPAAPVGDFSLRNAVAQKAAYIERVGPDKPLGSLDVVDVQWIEQILHYTGWVQERLAVMAQRGFSVVQRPHRDTLNGDMIYVYDKDSLQQLLDKNRDALQAAGVPTVADLFVDYIDAHDVSRADHPDAYKVIAMAYGDKPSNPTPGYPAVEVIHPEKLVGFEPRLILWDFDNTIWKGFPHDEEERLWARRAFQTESPTAEQLSATKAFFKTAQGLTREETIRKWRADGHPAPADFESFLPVLENGIDLYVQERNLATSPYMLPGVHESLRAIHSVGVTQKIVTGGDRDRRWAYAGRLGITPLFDGIHGGESKPKVVQRYVDEWGKQHVAMIGDGPADIEAPIKAGAVAIGFAETPEKRDTLIAAGADVIINRDFLSLSDILKTLKLDVSVPASGRAGPPHPETGKGAAPDQGSSALILGRTADQIYRILHDVKNNLIRMERLLSTELLKNIPAHDALREFNDRVVELRERLENLRHHALSQSSQFRELAYTESALEALEQQASSLYPLLGSDSQLSGEMNELLVKARRIIADFNDEQEKVAIDLSAVVQMTLEHFKNEHMLDQVLLVARYEAHLPTIQISLIAFDRLLCNLLLNAIEAMKHKEGEHRLAISTYLDPDGHTVVLKVMDTGIGISTADLPQIFDRGIGLASVKSIAKDMGATINVESEVGKGTTFTLRFPASAPGTDITALLGNKLGGLFRLDPLLDFIVQLLRLISRTDLGLEKIPFADYKTLNPRRSDQIEKAAHILSVKYGLGSINLNSFLIVRTANSVQNYPWRALVFADTGQNRVVVSERFLDWLEEYTKTPERFMLYLVQTLGHEKLRLMGGLHADAQDMFPLTQELELALTEERSESDLPTQRVLRDDGLLNWMEEFALEAIGPDRFKREASGSQAAHAIEAALDDASLLYQGGFHEDAVARAQELISDLESAQQTGDVLSLEEKWGQRYPEQKERPLYASELPALLQRAKGIRSFADAKLKVKPGNLAIDQRISNPDIPGEPPLAIPVYRGAERVYWTVFDRPLQNATATAGGSVKLTGQENPTPAHFVEKLKIAYPTLRNLPLVILVRGQLVDQDTYQIQQHDSLQAVRQPAAPDKKSSPKDFQTNTHPLVAAGSVGLLALSEAWRWQTIAGVPLPFDPLGILAFVYASLAATLLVTVSVGAMMVLRKWLTSSPDPVPSNAPRNQVFRLPENFPTNRALAREGWKQFHALMQSVSPALKTQLDQTPYVSNALLRVYLGVAGEEGSSGLLDYFVKQLDRREAIEFERAVERYPALRFVRYRNRDPFSLVNLEAAELIIRGHASFFPPEAVLNPKAWIISRPQDWFNSNKNKPDSAKQTRWGLLSGYPLSAARRFIDHNTGMQILEQEINPEGKNLNAEEKRALEELLANEVLPWIRMGSSTKRSATQNPVLKQRLLGKIPALTDSQRSALLHAQTVQNTLWDYPFVGFQDEDQAWADAGEELLMQLAEEKANSSGSNKNPKLYTYGTPLLLAIQIVAGLQAVFLVVLSALAWYLVTSLIPALFRREVYVPRGSPWRGSEGDDPDMPIQHSVLQDNRAGARDRINWGESLLQRRSLRPDDVMEMKSRLRQFVEGKITLREAVRSIRPRDRDFFAALLIASELSARYPTTERQTLYEELWNFLSQPTLVYQDNGPRIFMISLARITGLVSVTGGMNEASELLWRAKVEFMAARHIGLRGLRIVLQVPFEQSFEQPSEPRPLKRSVSLLRAA